ncbi:gamma-glutamylcyclotransferase family protein [Aureimonas endophytica]|nr:gamma-glutamylcyclotransferase family protein [Aureimonas endophytica]
MEYVFVYGTLKRGFPLFEKGLFGAEFVGACRTVQPYPLVIAMPFFGPVMLDRPGMGLPVQGELYRVAAEDLPRLDVLEDVGEPGSFRSRLDVATLSDRRTIAAIGFMKDERWLDPVHSGFMTDYQDTRFIPPWDR